MTLRLGALGAGIAVIALLAAPGARAQLRSRPGASGVLDVAVPERAAALRIRAEARARLLDALDDDRDDALGPADDVLLEQAIERYDVVLRVRPDDFDAWLERGLALAQWHRFTADGHEETRYADAIASYEHARALDPTRDPGPIAVELAILRTRMHDYAGAATEYQRAYEARSAIPRPLWWEPSQRELGLISLGLPAPTSTLLSNWAEVTMLAGDAAAAIERYRAVVDASRAGTVPLALALWGLALAEERSGSHQDAIEDALRAIDTLPADARSAVSRRYGPFAALHVEGVFFEPPCEIHAYESLGHEALASRASTEEGRLEAWGAARRSARFFLAEGGRTTPYADVAREADRRLSARMGE